MKRPSSKRPSTAAGSGSKKARGESHQQPAIPPHHPVLARSSYTVAHHFDRFHPGVYMEPHEQFQARDQVQAFVFAFLPLSVLARRLVLLGAGAAGSGAARHGSRPWSSSLLSRQLEQARSPWLLAHIFLLNVRLALHLLCQAQQYEQPLLESPALASEASFAQQFQQPLLESPALASEASFVPGEHETVQKYCCALTSACSMHV
eukprot:586818-Amphidinium_carterae.1